MLTSYGRLEQNLAPRSTERWKITEVHRGCIKNGENDDDDEG